jgi:hypothetical protein
MKRLATLLGLAACGACLDTGPGHFYLCDPGGTCSGAFRCVASPCAQEELAVPWCVPTSCTQDSDCGPVPCLNGHCGCNVDSDCPGSSCEASTGSCANEVCDGG